MRTSVVVVLALLLTLCCTIPSAAATAGICLSRDPSPPEAVYNDGTGKITFTWTVSCLTNFLSPALVLDAVPLSGSATNLFSYSGQPSPWGGSFQWTVPARTTPGNYRGKLSFYSDWTAPPPGLRAMEDEAQVAFIIAGAGRFKICKFNDWDGDGKWDKRASSDAYDEPPLSNWEFHIERPLSTVIRTIFTGMDGYTSDILLPMVPFNAATTTYYVREVLPACWERTKPVAEPYQLDLGQGPLASAIEYGNWQPAKLNIFKFNDADGDGTRDPGELGLSGWTFQIERPLGTIIKTVTTGSDGYTGETKLPVDPAANPMRYWVRELPHAGGCWTQTTPADDPHPVDVASCTTTQQEFGNWQPTMLRVFKYNDIDADGTRDVGEEPLSGWEFRLTSPSGVVTALKTGANGYTPYVTGPIGVYTIEEVVQPGWQKTTQNGQNPFTVNTVDCTPIDVLVGNFTPIRISGQVRLDMAPWPWTATHWTGPGGQGNDAAWEPGPCQDPPRVEGVDGVPVELWAEGVKLQSSVSAADGSFLFSGVAYRPNLVIKSGNRADEPPSCDPHIPQPPAHCTGIPWTGRYVSTVAMSPTAQDFATPCDLDLALAKPTVPNQEYGRNYFYERRPCRVWGIVHGVTDDSAPTAIEITVEKLTSKGPNDPNNGTWLPWIGTPKSCSTCGFYQLPVIGDESDGIRHGCGELKCGYRLTVGPPPGADQSWSATVCCSGTHSADRIVPDTKGAGSVSVEIDVCQGTDVRVDFLLSATSDRRCNLPVTLTQQDWHNLADPNTPGVSGGMLYNKFAPAFKVFDFYGKTYASTIVVGKQKIITFSGTTSSLTRLSKFFPQTGAPGKLVTNYGEPGTTSAGVLAGEVMALTMNVAYNDARVMPRTPGYNLENFNINYGMFKGKPVGYVLDIADRVLGGDPPSWYGLPDYDTLVQVLQAINANYQMSDINSFHDRGYLTPDAPPAHPGPLPHIPHVP